MTAGGVRSPHKHNLTNPFVFYSSIPCSFVLHGISGNPGGIRAQKYRDSTHYAANHLIFDLAAKPDIFSRSHYATIGCRFKVPGYPSFVVAWTVTYQKSASRLKPSHHLGFEIPGSNPQITQRKR